MKKLFYVLCVLLVVLGLAGAASAKVVIKLANAGPENPDNRTVKAVAIFKHLVETGTNGEVEVQAYHARKLGDEREALEGIRMGTIQMGTLSSGPVPGFFQPVMVYDIPYLFPNAPTAWEFFESEFSGDFAEQFRERTGVRILAAMENGYRHMSNNVREVKTPADIQGLKIRTMQNPVHQAMVQALGGTPTPIPFGELYMALQQKVVDGMECPIALYKDMKFYEVQKYLVLDGHLFNPMFVFINDRFFEKELTPEQQKVVADAAKVLGMAHNGFSEEVARDGLAALRAEGMEIYRPSAAELAEYRKVAQPAGLAFVEERVGKEWVEKAIAAVDVAAAKVGSDPDAIIAETIRKANEAYAAVN